MNGNSSEGYAIKRIEFGIITPEQIEQMSAAKIERKTLYDIDTRQPAVSGPLDRRLGLSVKTGTCQTCGDTLLACPGHFGHIDLPLPLFHIGLLKQTVGLLNCICKRCAALLLDPTRRAAFAGSDRPRHETVKAECRKAKSCPHCGYPNGSVKKNGGFRLYHEFQSQDEEQIIELNPQTCLNLFKMVSPQDYPLLGLKASPCSLLITKLAVPPPCIRPSVDMPDGFNEDDLTVKLSEIINTKGLVEDGINRGAPLAALNEAWDQLQLQVALLINADLPGVSTQSVPIRGLVQRLKGKGGRFRCNLSGKRVDFSGRTVISPDPNLSVEEVGVPEKMARVLTIPERVTALNIGKLQQMVKNGPETYPGANYVLAKDKSGREFRQFLRFGRVPELQIGDIVERHLVDGDPLLFNRQPSLHRMSIMMHRTRVHGHRTLRFNECVCAPYNADFDGDEMNIHVPQTVGARVEASTLMAVRRNLCTPRNGEPLISCTQDFVTGSYLLTGRDVLLTRSRFAQLCSELMGDLRNMPDFFRIDVSPAILRPMELFTGKQLFTLLIGYSLALAGKPRRQLSLRARNRSYQSDTCANDGLVLVVRGTLLCGRIDKAVIGAENRRGSLIYQLLRASPLAAVTALSCISRLSTRYLSERGFSIGYDDVFPTTELCSAKSALLRERFAQAAQCAAPLNNSCTPNMLEGRLAGLLSQIRDECGTLCMNTLSSGNSPVAMHRCGSKGSKINVSQMVACVGQQMVSGHRILNEMGNRTLPHFPPNSNPSTLAYDSPLSHGFVLNSFFSGLSSFELFFHAASGRVGLVDTAVKTAETGYMQRRLMKALEDLSVKYDGSVRNSFDDLVQMKYGEDGIEPLYDAGTDLYDWIYRDVLGEYHELLTAGIQVADSPISDTSLDTTLDCALRHISASSSCLSPLFLSLFRSSLSRSLSSLPIDPGSAVGAIAGQSIGEPTTQMTLETFHFAGVASANITLGVPRIREIINASSSISTPAIYIYISSFSNIRSSISNIRSSLSFLSFSSVCSSILQFWSPSSISLLFKIDSSLLSSFPISISGIELLLRPLAGIGSVQSDGILYNIKCVGYNYIFKLNRLINKILKVKINGNDQINKINIEKINEKYKIIVEGKGLLNVMGIDGVDQSKTISNDIIEVERVLGIEAARNLIIEEVNKTMAGHGISINIRHLMLLADTMTFKGAVLGITRFGISKMRASTLMLASFEQTADYLFQAAADGVVEPVEGISESIIMGVPIRLGSGTPMLLWDEKSINK